jgi:GxxExxY protein
MKQLKVFISFIEKLANEVYSTLGDGFSEDIYQKALASEFRNKEIDYLRETNVEIFYKDQMVGLGEIDFYFPPQKNKYFSLSQPIILETKYLAKLSDSARSQLRLYLMSTKKNKTKAITKLEYGLLLNWQKEAEYDDTRTSPKEPIQIELWKYTEENNLFKRLYKSH